MLKPVRRPRFKVQLKYGENEAWGDPGWPENDFASKQQAQKEIDDVIALVPQLFQGDFRIEPI